MCPHSCQRNVLTKIVHGLGAYLSLVAKSPVHSSKAAATEVGEILTFRVPGELRKFGSDDVSGQRTNAVKNHRDARCPLPATTLAQRTSSSRPAGRSGATTGLYA